MTRAIAALLFAVLLAFLPGSARAACATTAPEDPTNGADDDCDGSGAVRRDDVTDFASADAAEWTLTNGYAYNGLISLSPGGGTASAALASNLAWKTGLLYVHIDVEGLGSNTCRVEISDTTTPSTYAFALTMGTNEVAVPAIAPYSTLDRVAIVCVGSGSSVFDWLTVGNGAYPWAPTNDLDLSFSDAAFPGGGYSSVVVSHYDYVSNVIYAGMDVGGLGVSYDGGLSWETHNGRWDDWVNSTALSVWGITVRHEATLDRLFALTGDGSRSNGGLWASTTDGLDWTLLSKDLGAYQHGDGTSEKALASGRLLVEDAGNVYVANQLKGGNRMGMHVLDASNGVCEPFTGLPNLGSGEPGQVHPDGPDHGAHLVALPGRGHAPRGVSRPPRRGVGLGRWRRPLPLPAPPPRLRVRERDLRLLARRGHGGLGHPGPRLRRRGGPSPLRRGRGAPHRQRGEHDAGE